MTAGGRAAVARAIESMAVVAVIRLKDPTTLRAVVDALAEGGVRALEVTMTVPFTLRFVAALVPPKKPADNPEGCEPLLVRIEPE